MDPYSDPWSWDRSPSKSWAWTGSERVHFAVAAGMWRVKHMALNVYEANVAANRLYEKQGFQQVKTTQPLLGKRRSLLVKPVK